MGLSLGPIQVPAGRSGPVPGVRDPFVFEAVAVIARPRTVAQVVVVLVMPALADAWAWVVGGHGLSLPGNGVNKSSGFRDTKIPGGNCRE
jgi:hypothetical protein